MNRLEDAVKEWSPSERMLVATRLLTVVQGDLSSGRYAAPGRPTVMDVVSVLNAPSEVLDERRGFYSEVLTGESAERVLAESVSAAVLARRQAETEDDASMFRATHRDRQP